MDVLLHIKAALMGIVEGMTEFLPVSSTGHLILAGDLLAFNIPGRETFIVSIQTAAILAVCWEYRRRLLHLACGILNDRREQRLAINVIIAFLPAAALGVLFMEAIERALFAAVPVACAFILGGVAILFIERRHAAKDYAPRVETMDDMSWQDALKVGAAQCLALIPGMSRSGATIIGALAFGLSRRAAAEFSFFLAMPTIAGATVWTLWQGRDTLALEGQGPLYLTASVAAFASAFVCVRWLLRYVSTHDFTPFAWYRIAFGGVILATHALGRVAWS